MYRSLSLCGLPAQGLKMFPTVSSVAQPGGFTNLLPLARKWDPDLYEQLATPAPVFSDGLTPCLELKSGQKRCVPGAFLIGNWQSSFKAGQSLVGAHPDIKQSSNAGCFGSWDGDGKGGGSKWLRSQRLPADFDASKKLVAALGCVTSLIFYPGFAGEYHMWWEKSYWPCKAACLNDPACSRGYYNDPGPRGQWACKAKALAAHDREVALPAAGATPALNATPPFLMRAFYGSRVKLIAIVRSPIDRLRTAFYGHVHYQKRYGKGAAGFHSYAVEQLGAWRACTEQYGVTRCAVHFEQLGKSQSDVFFHCDQARAYSCMQLAPTQSHVHLLTPSCPSTLRTADPRHVRALRARLAARLPARAAARTVRGLARVGRDAARHAAPRVGPPRAAHV